MPSAYQIAVTVQRWIPRRWIAAVANRVMSIKGDKRRFDVDPAGNWINSQPEGSFVGPDLHTAHFSQVRTAVEGYWFDGYTPAENDVVIDVGAGIGEDAVILSHRVGPGGRVHAIEAHPATFACLEATVRRSGLLNVTNHLLAITETNGTVSISDDAHHLANSIVGTGKGIEIEAQSLDDFIERQGISRVDLLKLNIEGAERGAMSGLQQQAAKVRNLAISCHDFVADKGGGDEFRTKDEVRKRMTELGFVVSERTDAATPWEADVLFGRRI